VEQNRYGTPFTKHLAQVVRWDPSECTTQLAGIYATMFHPSQSEDPGVLGIPREYLHRNMGLSDEKNLTTLQEEAMGIQAMIDGIGARVVEGLLRAKFIQMPDSLVNANEPDSTKRGDYKNDYARQTRDIFVKELGIFSDTPNEEYKKIMADIFLRNLPYGTTVRKLAEDRFMGDAATKNGHGMAALGDGASGTSKIKQVALLGDIVDTDVRFAKLVLDPLGTGMGAFHDSYDAKRARCFGKAMGGAAPSDTLHSMISHFSN